VTLHPKRKNAAHLLAFTARALFAHCAINFSCGKTAEQSYGAAIAQSDIPAPARYKI